MTRMTTLINWIRELLGIGEELFYVNGPQTLPPPLTQEEENELTDTESQLVLDCCRYIWNDAFEDFANNFLGTVNGARAKREIAAAEVDDSG